jgi:hypothetical protein
VCEVVVLDDYGARAAGQLCGATEKANFVGSSVVVAARGGMAPVITTDLADLRLRDRHVDLVAI